MDLAQITYETNVDLLEEVDTLFIYDLPTDLHVLNNIVRKMQPKNIHVCFYVENSIYLKAFPTRNDIKWFYSIVYKRKEIDLKRELANIMDAKKWSKEHTSELQSRFDLVCRLLLEKKNILDH